MMYTEHFFKNNRGMTLVEVVFAVAVMLLIFGGLIIAFESIVGLIGSSKSQAGAVSLANEELEYIRSLSYSAVGTVGGIPDGLIPQVTTKSLNGITYTQRVLIEYVDDSHDGKGAADTNGILADYKLVKVEYSWLDKAQTKDISLISNIIPKGIETTAGGGTLTVNVFDSNVHPLEGASVHVYNNSGTTTIDTTRYSDATGVAMFAGAPARANYRITVTDVGFSTDQTYSASSTNPNPITPHVAVLKSAVSTMNFQIDKLSTTTVKTLGLPTTASFEDLLNSTTSVATTSHVNVALGAAKLQGAPGSYSPSGTLFSTAVTPGTLSSWSTMSYQADVPAATAIVVRVYDRTGTTTPKLISDSVLPGNSTGFARGTVDISALDTSIYQSIALGAALTSSNVATTSSLLSWRITYTTAQSNLASIPFTLTSKKIIGTNASAQPVYKYQKSFTTNGSGKIVVPNLEWGVYDVAVTNASYDIAEACSDIPYVLKPGISDTLTLTLAPAAANTLRVRVLNASGTPIPNATVSLTRSGFSASQETSLCGQTFFNSGVPSAADFTVSVHAYGYVDQSVANVNIAGDATAIVSLVSS